jgi:cyclopropane-fatty-acyl-phospholipid synthase
MNLIPASIIMRRWYDALGRLKYGTLHFVTPKGERITFKGPLPGPEAEFAIQEWDVIRRMAVRGDVAMGEDYIAQKWTTDHVEHLFSLFLLNLEELEGFANGNRINRLALSLNNRLVRRNSRSGSRSNIMAHYDVGNDFYALWLDRTMTYSSALYAHGATTLEEAQRHKYQRILGKVESDSASILEVGCGWGGFAEEAVHANHRLTGLTISPAQHDFATKRLQGNADIRMQDYRDVQGTYDLIASIEMFEAVGEQYWPNYFQMLSARLAERGKAVIQTITIRDDLFALYRSRSDFVRHYVFPGGLLPSKQRFIEEAGRAGLRCTEAFSFGQDYATTLRQWIERFDAQRSNIKALGHSDAFIRNWQYYLGMCAAAFAIDRTDVVQMELVHA